MKRSLVRALSIVALLVVAAPVFAGNTTSRSMTMNFYTPMVDEQGLGGCSNPAVVTALFNGDNCATAANGNATVYSFLNSPWTAYTPVTGVAYVDGADCNPKVGTCMSVQLNKNLSTLSVDTRNSYDPSTAKPRVLSINFGSPCPECPYGAGPASPFGGPVTNMPGLLSVFITGSFTSMAVCSSEACPEGEIGTARFWFADPNGDPNLNYRVDWGTVRVLRMSTNTWYAVASPCDGTQVGTLYRLNNNRKNVTTSRLGSYKIPFLISGVQ